jgi:hypothetical protein
MHLRVQSSKDSTLPQFGNEIRQYWIRGFINHVTTSSSRLRTHCVGYVHLQVLTVWLQLGAHTALALSCYSYQCPTTQ